MKKHYVVLVVIGIIAFCMAAYAAGPFPHKEFGEKLGKDGRSYETIYLKNSVIFEGATSDQYEATVTITDPTADRTITFADASGTVALACGATHNYGAANANWNLTVAEAACGYLYASNASNAAYAVLPSCTAGQYYTLYNNSGANITLKVSGQTGAVTADSKFGLYVCNGTDVLQIYTTP